MLREDVEKQVESTIIQFSTFINQEIEKGGATEKETLPSLVRALAELIQSVNPEH